MVYTGGLDKSRGIDVSLEAQQYCDFDFKPIITGKVMFNMLCEMKFREIYGVDSEDFAFCPYRVCPVGAHVDHNLGVVTGFAIDRGIRIAYRPTQDGTVELCSMQFEKRVQWDISSVPARRQNDWADYLRGASLALSRVYPLSVGLCGVIEGTLPIGGLSSSAAVTIAFLIALCKVNGIRLSEHEMIRTALEAENDYVGVSCGKLDQSCAVLCRKDSLLYMDMKDDACELIPRNPDMKAFRIGVFFSGVERTLKSSGYNMRVDELRSAAYALKAYAGMGYGKFSETNLRDVPVEVFREYGNRLPENWRKRAEHWYSECARVNFAADAWRKGNLETFGRLSFESGKSSIDIWETGSPELKAIYEIMTRTDGIYGGRFSGAGFKGCCVALVDPGSEDHIREKITDGYLKVFPALKDKFSVRFCDTADGANFSYSG